MGAVRFVTGRSGAGKTALVLSLMTGSGKGGEALLIVPEQATFEAERALACEAAGSRVTVCSFTTLSRRIIEESGMQAAPLSSEGRRMRIRRAIEENASSLNAFAHVASIPGFALKCDELFSLFKRFDITPESLRTAASRVNAPLLQSKAAELALLYGAAESYSSGAFLDASDELAALISLLPASRLNGADIFIDGFDLLTEQLYSLIAAMMAHAASLTVTFRMDPSPDVRDAEVFAPERRAYGRLLNAARDLGINPEIICLEPGGALSRKRGAALCHLEHEAFAWPAIPFDGKPEGITVFAASSPEAEAEAVADAVLCAARSGMRYRDMTLIATDMERCAASISRALKKRLIPYFMDAKHPLARYALPELLHFSLRAASRGFAAADVLSVAKNPLSGVSPDAAELLENHVLERGLRGRALKEPLRAAHPEAEAARKLVIEPLSVLHDGLVSASTAAGKTEALYRYMEALSLRDKMYKLTEGLRDAGRLELMEENAQVFNCVIELLEELHGIMGGSRMGITRFLAILDEGLSAYEIGAVPTTADQLLFGSVGRTRGRAAKAVFIVGALEGSFPAYMSDDSVINDAELLELAAAGLPAWDSSLSRSAVERLNAYGALARPTESLYISYPLRSGGDGGIRAAIIDRLFEIFPSLTQTTDVGVPRLPESPGGGLIDLAARLRTTWDTASAPEGTEALYAYYAGAPEYRESLSLIESALDHRASPEPLGREAARLLYGSGARGGGATRLEAFNACPFKHFARYGLHADERAEQKERPAEEGSLIHAALSSYINALMSHGDINAITDEHCVSMLEDILPPLLMEHNGGILLSTARMRVRAAELTAMITDTALAVTHELKESAFSVSGTETVFGEGAAFPPLRIPLSGGGAYLLSGRIDRLDHANAGNTRFTRVVDYKTGEARFNLSELAAGLKLQLPLYCVAAEAALCGARAAGMFYQPVRRAVADGEANTDEATFKAELEKLFRLSGISLSDAALERENAGRQRSSLLSHAEMERLSQRALDIAAQSAEGILEGRAETRPYRKSAEDTACTYCEYKSLCGFDARLPGCAYRVVSSQAGRKLRADIAGGDAASNGGEQA